jgi:alkaline phosphatase
MDMVIRIEQLGAAALALGLAVSSAACDNSATGASAPVVTTPAAPVESGDLDVLRAAALAAGATESNAVFASNAPGAANVRVRLPERFRVLEQQYFDIRIEASGISSTGVNAKLYVDGVDVSTQLGAPEITTDNDNDAAHLDKAWTWRKVSFSHFGSHTIGAIVTDAHGPASTLQPVNVQRFAALNGTKKNIVLFLGDAMGTTYRDAGRLVAMATGGRMREGFFDDLQAMDTMPVSGMVMTYAMDNIVPDSANTATAWSTGSKTINGALGVFPDNDDFRFSSSNIQGTKQYALDNPRVETLWEYLKRRYGYKTGVVTTADVTDATPAGEGGHTITRNLLDDVARQYVDGTFVPGPTFDVVMGGGREHFDARTTVGAGDTRNFISELTGAGYTFVSNRTELNALGSGEAAPAKLLGLFRTSHMNVAYDKLGLVRPSDEAQPSFAGFTDQPFLDEMTRHAIDALSVGGGPFIVMIEGASIDKQSHSNFANGQIWDTIEFDKSVRVGRDFAAANAKTLVLVTADHDQSMHILGVVDSTVPGAVLNVHNNQAYTGLVGGSSGFPDYEDANGDGYPENTNRYRLAVGYRTGDHTGSSVPITADGPGALLFTGYFDQTEIFFRMAGVLTSNTSALDAAVKQKVEFPLAGPNY